MEPNEAGLDDAFVVGSVALLERSESVTSDERPWWAKKTTWAAVTAALSLIGTIWSFIIDASPVAKAIFATVTGLAGILEGVFIASRVTRISRSSPNTQPPTPNTS